MGKSREVRPSNQTMCVLLAPSTFLTANDGGGEAFQRHGIEARANPYGRTLTAPEVIELAADCDGILSGNEPLTADVLARLPRLRCISRCGAGTDNVDLAAARAQGIDVYRTPDAPVQAVAELTLGLVLTLLRRIHELNTAVHARGWPRILGSSLSGRAVGIVGLGRIGRAVAGLLTPFGCRLMASDPSPDSAAWATSHGVEMVEFSELLKHAQVVLLHAPAGEQALMGERELRLMRSGAILVNTARGSLVDEEALHSTIVDGHLAGAALDVFRREPYQGPLTELDSVVLTPHIASFTAEGRAAMEREAVAHLIGGLGYR